MRGSVEHSWGWGHCAPSPLLLLTLLLFAAPFGLLGEKTRQVSLEVIPNWLGPVQNLLHIRAVGTNSTLHYMWSSLGPLAVVLVATNTPHSTLSVNWSRLLSPEPDGGLMVLPKDSIQFSSALVFTRLLEFDSTNVSDTAAKTPGTPYPPYSLADFSWNNITDSLDPATLSATFQGHPMNDPTRTFANGSLAFRVQAFSRSSRPAQPPRLLHTADTCQLEVALVGASPRGNRSLFGLEVATLGQGPDCPSMQEQHSIDDEYAPAIFQVDAPGCGLPSSGWLVPTSPGHHGSGPGCPRAHAASGRLGSAAVPQEVLRVPVHKLRPALWREGHYWTCLVPQNSGGWSIKFQSAPSLPRLAFLWNLRAQPQLPGDPQVGLPSYLAGGTLEGVEDGAIDKVPLVLPSCISTHFPWMGLAGLNERHSDWLAALEGKKIDIFFFTGL
ncbi:glycosylated lysosomal membrane protein isoform X3 [Rhinopithecus roxellana]|uniref:glycosylated lysosomal membrane protein isoform X3 n=1 Tax=Rhinopithecus roxellana TaxID=61622 RepID=UPI0005330F9E|nr:glycosylated lysosomal membrane protein isoform X3 [Rhinopithecus roxellana]